MKILSFLIAVLCCWQNHLQADLITLDFSQYPVGTVITNQFVHLGIQVSAVQPFAFAGPRVSSSNSLNLYHSNNQQICDVLFEFPNTADFMRFQIVDADEPSTVRVFNDGTQIFSQFFPSGSDTQVYTFQFGQIGGSIRFDSILFDAVNSGSGNSPGPEALRNIQYSPIPEPSSFILVSALAAVIGVKRSRKLGSFPGEICGL